MQGGASTLTNEPSRRFLINAANLHNGGGIQVAASVVNELASSGISLEDTRVIASSEVVGNLSPTVADALSLSTMNVQGFDRKSPVFSIVDEFDAVFTVFGPLYKWSTKARSIVGFAQPWIIYPRNECYDRMTRVNRIKTKMKYWIQAQFFKKADTLVVELEHVKEGLVRELGINPDKIEVVRNCVSSVFRQEELWEAFALPEAPADLKLGYLGRNYLHKNTRILPDIVKALKSDHGMDATFYVTFTDQEWQSTPQEFRNACVNVGPLRAAQCPQFYKSLDGVVFPSLLECFSATPLEAMAMGVPLFASDRPFNRDICSHHAYYFDPMDPASAAEQISRFFKNGGVVTNLDAARAHALAFSNPAERARKYMSILQQ